MRQAAKRDRNEGEIVAALRQVGALVSLYEWLRSEGCISRHTCQWVRP